MFRKIGDFFKRFFGHHRHRRQNNRLIRGFFYPRKRFSLSFATPDSRIVEEIENDSAAVQFFGKRKNLFVQFVEEKSVQRAKFRPCRFHGEINRRVGDEIAASAYVTQTFRIIGKLPEILPVAVLQE